MGAQALRAQPGMGCALLGSPAFPALESLHWMHTNDSYGTPPVLYLARWKPPIPPPSSLRVVRMSNTVADADLWWACEARVRSIFCCSARMITDVGLLALRRSNTQGLVHLQLACLRSHITPEAFGYLTSSSLEWLDPRGSRAVTDVAMSTLSALKLKYLNVAGCSRITTVGFQSINIPTLECLVARTSVFDDDAASSLPSGLRSLDVGDSLITDVALAHISRLQLSVLHVSWCGDLTDHGMCRLAGMPLREISIVGCITLTSEWLERIRSEHLTKVYAGVTLIVSAGDRIPCDMRHIVDTVSVPPYLTWGGVEEQELRT